jgi:ubiquinone/menaquinone biosynthesis C-methylase UbiE
MEADEYTRLAEQEDRLWWFQVLRRNLFATFDRVGLETTLRCLDLGSGTGGLVALLRDRYPKWDIHGMDRSSAALRYASQKFGPLFCGGDAAMLPFRDRSFDLVISIDVLCVREVNDKRMLAECLRVLAPGGLLVLNNPAYNWMFSYHDRFVHTARRYTRRRIVRDLRSAGLEPVLTSYWNTILFPLMVLKRKVVTFRAEKSDVHETLGLMNRAFSFVARPEAICLRRGLSLPFGGSVLAVARKPLQAGMSAGQLS